MRARCRAAALALLLALAGCAAVPPAVAPGVEPASAEAAGVVGGQALLAGRAPEAPIEARILALDPGQVSDSDVRTLLAAGPTPRIVLLHGGIYPVHLVMESFARFLVGMGYPKSRLEHPGDGRRSHSPYEPSPQIAGLIAWYYEHEALMPMLIGHSQGGIQLVKVLYDLDGDDGGIHVWNPLTGAAEPRERIVDPYTGALRPVVGLKVGYASVVGAGGAALLLPNQWSMARRLRAIPDSVTDFDGYTVGLDLIAWDLPGAANDYRARGTARVRNVELPVDYSHVFVPQTAHLARDPAMRAWLNAYRPGQAAAPPPAGPSAENSLWAAEVWYQIKKHWVIEAQKLLRARQQLRQAQAAPPHALRAPDAPDEADAADAADAPHAPPAPHALRPEPLRQP